MITISDYISEVYNDFKHYVETTDKLCDLRTLNYQKGKVPDYTDIHIQQLYLLRYAFAYAFEYKRMFLHLFKNEEFQNNISLTSIGCGNMIDYWSLVKALEKIKNDKISVKYRGIDAVDWEYKIESREDDDVAFKQGDALSILQSSRKLISDIYIFPKSISEFSNEEFKQICEVFEKDNFVKDRVHFLISIRSDEWSRDRDMERSKSIKSAMIRNGFKTKSNARGYLYFEDNEKGIKGVDPSFDYPNEAKDMIYHLDEYCNKYEECDECCEGYLNRRPVLTIGNVYYQVLTFYRED